MPRKRRISGSKKKPREAKDVRTLRSDKVDTDKGETDGDSSDSSSTPERKEESPTNGAGQPAMKLAPIFEKFMTVKKSTLNVSLEEKKSSQDESKLSPLDMEKKESRDSQASASPEVISLMTGDREVNISQEKIEEVSLNIESVRKRLFSNGEVVEHREGGGVKYTETGFEEYGRKIDEKSE